MFRNRKFSELTLRRQKFEEGAEINLNILKLKEGMNSFGRRYCVAAEPCSAGQNPLLPDQLITL